MDKFASINDIEELNINIRRVADHAQQLADKSQGRIADRLNEIAGTLRLAKAQLMSVRLAEDVSRESHMIFNEKYNKC